MAVNQEVMPAMEAEEGDLQPLQPTWWLAHMILPLEPEVRQEEMVPHHNSNLKDYRLLPRLQAVLRVLEIIQQMEELAPLGIPFILVEVVD